MRALRAFTYNLLAGHDDDVARLEQATLLLQAARPDVLALNECTLLAQDDAARLQALEAALGMQALLALAPSGYHVALLLRDAIIEHTELIDEGLSHAAVLATATIGSQRLQVIATHLDPFSASKRAQEVELLAARFRNGSPSLLLGDLNAVSPRDLAAAHPEAWPERYRARHLDAAGAIDTRAIELLQDHPLTDVHAALHTQTAPTRPSTRYARADRPSQRLDYIFASPELARTATACEPFQHAHTQTASDHLPLYADFAFS
jgi:endonuclease/exonuclease/phosphatase family metal-dependent hydrolase